MYILDHIAHGRVLECGYWPEFEKKMKKLKYPKPDMERLQRFVEAGNAFSYAVGTLTAFKKPDGTKNSH